VPQVLFVHSRKAIEQNDLALCTVPLKQLEISPQGPIVSERASLATHPLGIANLL
jgi:hypothetical protein